MKIKMSAPKPKDRSEITTYVIDVEKQIKDSVFSLEELVSHYEAMKIKGKPRTQNRRLNVEVSGSKLIVSCAGIEKLYKKDIKQYMKRFLKKKELIEFLRVSGDADTNVVTLNYVNNVVDEE